MARKPQQKRAKVTVETIIEAGFISVARHGTEGTTTRQVAEIAGIGIGSLYEYFENKDAIYRAMNQHFIDEVLQMLQELTPEIIQLDLHDVIQLMLYKFSELLQRNDARYLKCVQYAGQFDYAKYAQQVESALVEIVMRYVMHHPKYLRLDNMATMIYVCINGAIFLVIRHLILPNANISFDEAVRGTCRMIESYVNAELAAADEK
ncbi:MAG: TetR/AcrR family transcriptional regulator [Pseudomonadota bacterium]|nr:TetR/AcrR family transcriptional regulator [Pseudomonadota bacterium]